MVENVSPMPASDFGTLVDLIRKLDPDAADEMEASRTGGHYGFVYYDIKFRNGKAQIRSKAIHQHNTRTIGMARASNGNTTIATMAASLYHEWEHARDRNGHGGQPATTSEQENSPCAHMEEYEAEMELLCRLADCAVNDPNSDPSVNPPFGPKECASFDSVVREWRARYRKCFLYVVSELPTWIPVSYQDPDPPCTPQGCN